MPINVSLKDITNVEPQQRTQTTAINYERAYNDALEEAVRLDKENKELKQIIKLLASKM